MSNAISSLTNKKLNYEIENYNKKEKELDQEINEHNDKDNEFKLLQDQLFNLNLEIEEKKIKQSIDEKVNHKVQYKPESINNGQKLTVYHQFAFILEEEKQKYNLKKQDKKNEIKKLQEKSQQSEDPREKYYIQQQIGIKKIEEERIKNEFAQFEKGISFRNSNSEADAEKEKKLLKDKQNIQKNLEDRKNKLESELKKGKENIDKKQSDLNKKRKSLETQKLLKERNAINNNKTLNNNLEAMHQEKMHQEKRNKIQI
jgi:hypothetical protein